MPVLFAIFRARLSTSSNSHSNGKYQCYHSSDRLNLFGINSRLVAIGLEWVTLGQLAATPPPPGLCRHPSPLCHHAQFLAASGLSPVSPLSPPDTGQTPDHWRSAGTVFEELPSSSLDRHRVHFLVNCTTLLLSRSPRTFASARSKRSMARCFSGRAASGLLR